MIDRLKWLNKIPFINNRLLLVFTLFIAAVIWRYWQFMPQVFFGDDLMYLLAFEDGTCGASIFEIATNVCWDKFRPVASGYHWLLMSLFGSNITYYMVVNILVHAISASLVFTIAYRLSKDIFIVALSIAIVFATSRFAVYQVTQMVGGVVEEFALPIFFGVLYSLIRADERQGNALKWCVFAIVLSFFLIHVHERYIPIAVFLGLAFIAIPNCRALPRRHFVALLAMCIVLPIFVIAYKIAILHKPFLVGTGGSQLDFDFGRTVEHLWQVALSIFGFNEGPEYLVGVRLVSLPWYPAWLLAATFTIAVVSSIVLGVRGVLVRRERLTQALQSMRWPILFVVLAVFLLVPPILTVRLEQRWLFVPYILILLIGAWAVGQCQKQVKNIVLILIVIFSVSAILLDSLIIKHFNQVFYVSSARFAEMAKRDIADKYSGKSTGIDLLTNQNHCNWTLMRGGFFRVYGGQARELQCLNLNDTRGEAHASTELRQVFAELTRGHLSDITGEWGARVRAERGRVSFDFINTFADGHINNSAKVSTPSGMGALVLPSASVFGTENIITVLSGFSYRFDDILIERSSELRFGLSMIYPAEPMKAIVYVVEKNESNQKIIFSQKVNSPPRGERLRFSSVQIPLAAFEGKRISLVFSAENAGTDTTGQWLGYSNPRIFLPAQK